MTSSGIVSLLPGTLSSASLLAIFPMPDTVPNRQKYEREPPARTEHLVCVRPSSQSLRCVDSLHPHKTENGVEFLNDSHFADGRPRHSLCTAAQGPACQVAGGGSVVLCTGSSWTSLRLGGGCRWGPARRGDAGDRGRGSRRDPHDGGRGQAVSSVSVFVGIFPGSDFF